MDTIKIKALLTAIKLKSLSMAAEEFSYTPSAFSHMADALEEELGIKLLNRTSKGVSLSEDGEKILDKLGAVVDAENELLDAVGDILKRKENTLKIASYSSVAEQILPEILMGFKKKYPSIKYSVCVTDNVEDLLKKGEVDIIFTDSGVSRFELVPIMEEEYVVATKSDLFMRKKSVKREELYAYNYIDIGENLLKDYFDYERFAEVIKLETHEFATVLSMVKGGLGVAVLPALAVKNKKEIKTLMLEPSVSRAVGYAIDKGIKSKSSTQKFIKYLEEKYRKK
jgi:DNA-binding transcriptional LysR family regulator